MQTNGTCAAQPCHTLAKNTRVQIQSPNLLAESEVHLDTKYVDSPVTVQRGADGSMRVCRAAPREWVIRTDKRAPAKLGLMLVGWGGNNGSTLTAALLANRLGLAWESRRGTERANFLGSLVMASTVSLGFDAATGQEVFLPMSQVVPFADPAGIVVGGWDISGLGMGDALLRSRVLEPDLIRQVKPLLDGLTPLPSVYSPDFIAGNQAARADNVLKRDKAHQLAVLRQNIRDFRAAHGVDRVVVMWTANTERFARLDACVHGTADGLLAGITRDEPEISPSTLFAVAAVLEGCPFVNGSPQNTCVPAVVELAARHGVPIGGDDFKSGQTKVKSVLVDFLIGAGIKPLSIVSYNHLGNNDGKNLDEAAQFSSKERSKRGVVEDMVASNPLMYPPSAADGAPLGAPDHKVVIEYVPAVGDSKRALDEYESEIFMGGRHTLVLHQTCEDSLLAAPLMLDLVLLVEFFARVQVAPFTPDAAYEAALTPLHPVMSLLAFCLKAPLFPPHAPVVNALGRQRRAIEALLRACVGLAPPDDLCLAQRL